MAGYVRCWSWRVRSVKVGVFVCVRFAPKIFINSTVGAILKMKNDEGKHVLRWLCTKAVVIVHFYEKSDRNLVKIWKFS
jgi:hypothetical protein